jgi:hypothetical protein
MTQTTTSLPKALNVSETSRPLDARKTADPRRASPRARPGRPARSGTPKPTGWYGGCHREAPAVRLIHGCCRPREWLIRSWYWIAVVTLPGSRQTNRIDPTQSRQQEVPKKPGAPMARGPPSNVSPRTGRRKHVLSLGHATCAQIPLVLLCRLQNKNKTKTFVSQAAPEHLDPISVGDYENEVPATTALSGKSNSAYEAIV